MANMGYCRFQNTLGDLLDCKEALENQHELGNLSRKEKQAAKSLVETCREITEWITGEDLPETEQSFEDILKESEEQFKNEDYE